MSVIHPDEWLAGWAPQDDTCFLCHEPVCLFSNSVGVMWMGTTEIVLHPGCAAKLGAELLKDSREAELAGGEQPWRRRAARVFRSALRIEEARR